MLKFFAVLYAFILFSCASGPVVIPEDATPDKLIQLGQEASGKNKYGQALQYYQAVLDRYTTLDYVCDAEYSIAFIYYKQKKYDLASQGFETLLSVRYTGPDADIAPGRYKVLAETVLKKIKDKGLLKR